mmetsp:Transcript_11835/g.18169  ORF Transcript_11835/g.18169 Transcript_11835/m.18169 type:complete len:319 (+) Transcript_11835:167-1123(+)|eukprot:CAMPEP_0178894870 /NCGR_PEP_ID=MMETSP0786-20121207/258_1 /TAXON_ID=186022 /ORGANISM="Thalassionema frauenfeldii, Strain CCMP 1798" /LENGTH=318 /DNA_ID=CAMNT_0020565011 /DNA_START=244 /DNA_END=1200 /DNA_ORIENTATION=+
MMQRSINPRILRHAAQSTLLSSTKRRLISTNNTSAKTKSIIVKQESRNAHTTSVVTKLMKEKDHPSLPQLKQIFIASAVPMVAFGFMDNLIMIQAGGYIDATFGAALGLATLSAAAMGQVVSDVSGVAFGGVVERSLNMKLPTLTEAQRVSSVVRNTRMAGSILGIALGCLLGATSLLFMDLEARDRQERTKDLRDVISKMILEDNEETGLGQDCTIHLTSLKAFDINGEKGSLRVQQLSEPESEEEISDEILCARNSVSILKSNRLYVPIVESSKKVLGVLEFRASSEFTMEDKHSARIVAKHVGIFMERLADQSYD